MQNETSAISKKDREKARIVLSLFQASEVLGAAMKTVRDRGERELIYMQYKTHVDAVRERIQKLELSKDEAATFTAEIERAISYLDESIARL
jgi:hypothetical protein